MATIKKMKNFLIFVLFLVIFWAYGDKQSANVCKNVFLCKNNQLFSTNRWNCAMKNVTLLTGKSRSVRGEEGRGEREGRRDKACLVRQRGRGLVISIFCGFRTTHALSLQIHNLLTIVPRSNFHVPQLTSIDAALRDYCVLEGKTARLCNLKKLPLRGHKACSRRN